MPVTRRRLLRSAGGSGYAVQGIDVPGCQGTVNWTSVRKAGITFASTKASEGTTYTNPTIAANRKGVRADRIVRGACHYGRTGTDAAALADFFVNTVGPQAGDLQLVLDLEAADGKTATEVRNRIVAVCGRLQSGVAGRSAWNGSLGSLNHLRLP